MPWLLHASVPPDSGSHTGVPDGPFAQPPDAKAAGSPAISAGSILVCAATRTDSKTSIGDCFKPTVNMEASVAPSGTPAEYVTYAAASSSTHTALEKR